MNLENLKKSQLISMLKNIRKDDSPSDSILSPEKACDVITETIENWQQENFVVICLDAKKELLSSKVITTGILTQTPIHPREVFAFAIEKRADTIIIAHNHPSGHCSPSDADKEITERFEKSGEILGIKVLDHIIVTAKGDHFSFQFNTL